MKNHELIEEYPRDYEQTQFEKILVTAKRAKDIHNNNKTPLVDSIRKSSYIALEEFNARKINSVYREEEIPIQIDEDNDDQEDED